VSISAPSGHDHSCDHTARISSNHASVQTVPTGRLRTDEELEIFAEYAGEKTVGWITKTLRRRTEIGRSYNAVKCKAEEIGRSLRLGSGYSQNDIVQLFGTTQSTVAKWFAMDWLVADNNGRCWEENIV